MGNLTRYAKFVTAVLGALSAAATQGLLPNPYAQWVPIVIMFASAIGVYLVPNSPPPGKPSDPNISERASKTRRQRGDTHASRQTL